MNTQPLTPYFTTLLKSKPPWVVGILNVTPDSFSDGGRYLAADEAIAQARRLLDDGAHIIEIGGESTGPGAKSISVEEELKRIKSVVQALAPVCDVAVDTYKAATASEVLKLGARIINDVSALRAEPELAEVVRDHDACLVLMHNKESNLPHVTTKQIVYHDIIGDIISFFEERIDFAVNRGVKREHLILDPGMGGFLSSTPDDSWEVLRRFDELVNSHLGCPWMIGTSRKGFLGGPINQRDPISQLTALSAVTKGAAFIRTHNVKMAGEFLTAHRRLN